MSANKKWSLPSSTPSVDLSSESPKNLPELFVRFGEDACRQKLLSEPDTLTEGEKRIGKLRELEASGDIEISMEMKALRNTPRDQLDPNIVRWTPKALVGRLARNKSVLTKLEIEIAEETRLQIGQRVAEKLKASHPTTKHKMGDLPIEITPEARMLRKVDPKLLPPDLIRYSPTTCGTYLSEGKESKMTKIEREIGERIHSYNGKKRPRSYSIAGENVTIGSEERFLRSKKPSEIPPGTIRYSPGTLMRDIYARRTDHLTKAEIKMGFIAGNLRGSKIPLNIRLMRNIPVSEVPPGIVRYTPETLAVKVKQKRTELLTLEEIKIGEKEIAARYKKRNKL